MSENCATNEHLLHQEARSVAHKVAQQAGITDELWEVRVRGVSSWVYADGRPEDPPSPTTAIKLVLSSENPEELHAQTIQETRMLEGLHNVGAPVLRSLIAPILSDNFVATATEWLPGAVNTSTEDFRDYGRALGELRMAGHRRQDIVAQAKPFDPLADVRETLDFMREHPAQVQAQGISQAFIEETYAQRLKQGEAAVGEVQILMNEKGYQEVIIQPDVTPYNARRDRQGRATIIDMDNLMRGPAEFTMARPLDQWQRNFDRPLEWVDNIRQGHNEAAGPLDEEISERAFLISWVKYAAVPFKLMVSALRQQQQPDDWARQEGRWRLTDRNRYWYSLEDYLAANRGHTTA